MLNPLMTALSATMLQCALRSWADNLRYKGLPTIGMQPYISDAASRYNKNWGRIMEMTGRVATWLELAVAPEWRKQRSKVRLHAVGGQQDRCFALSMDGRWLCASNGKLTVFRGRDAAEHFLKAVKIDHFETGDPPPRHLCCDAHHFGLRLDQEGCLAACRTVEGKRRFID